ncbi:hypothetical protein C8J57DRAFT_1229972 [Mycena rebaudengoi]|nr:hypothetical protein C8J57DRAFT_1229972 [Mycena rebaudengoi]
MPGTCGHIGVQCGAVGCTVDGISVQHGAVWGAVWGAVHEVGAVSRSWPVRWEGVRGQGCRTARHRVTTPDHSGNVEPKNRSELVGPHVGVEEAGDREFLTLPNVFIAVGAIWVGRSPNFDGELEGEGGTDGQVKFFSRVMAWWWHCVWRVFGICAISANTAGYCYFGKGCKGKGSAV